MLLNADCVSPGTCNGTTSVTAVYTVGLFVSTDGQKALENTAIYGSFNNATKTWPSNRTNYPGKQTGDPTNCDLDEGGTGTGSNCNAVPASSIDWDKDADGVADTFFYAEDATAIKNKLQAAIEDMLSRVSSGTAASVLASGEGSGANIVQSIFYPKRVFSGTTSGVSWIGTLANMWYYIDPNLRNSSIREDTDLDRTLKLTQDRIVEYTFNAQTQQTGMNLFVDTDGNSIKDNTTADATANIDSLKYLWEAGKLLLQKTPTDDNSGTIYSGRTIYTNANADDANGTSTGSFTAFSATTSNSTLRPLLNVATDDDASNLISYIRGSDDVVISTISPVRSRETTVDIDGTNVSGTWKLGDVINSTPKIVSWLPLNLYDKTYNDYTYKQFYSSAAYKDRGMVFVGGNDGMLHAFKLGLFGVYSELDRKAVLGKICSATSTKTCTTSADCPGSETCIEDANVGQEAWTFIPKNALPYLQYQADPDYCHLYSIDQTSVIFDASINKPSDCAAGTDYWNCYKTSDSWRTVLIGGMRYGGACRNNGTSCSECITTPISGVGYSSYFALDITNPESPTLLWEYANSALGLSSTGPSIVRINSKSNCSVQTATSCDYDGDCPADETCKQNKVTNGKWFVVFGSGPSGYVSPSSKQFIGVTEHSLPVAGKGKIMLDVLDLKTGTRLREIDAGEDGAFAGSFANSSLDVDPDSASPGSYSDDAIYFGYTLRNALGATSTAQAGSTSNTIKLAAASSATSGFYNGKFVHRTDGIHETKLIVNYDGSTKIATMDSNWQLTPTNATQYNILDGWNTGGVKRVLTKESLDPNDWTVSKVMATTGPVTSAVAKLLDTKTKKLRLYFGTGRYFYKIGQIVDDANATRRLYGIVDPCFSSSGLDKTCTTTVSEASLGAAYTASDTNTDGSTDIYGNTSVNGSSDAEGWYIPLQANYGLSGAERNITDPLATQIGVVFFTTMKPSTDICSFGGKSYVWAIRYDTGGSIGTGILKGKSIIQLSTGAIQEVDMSSAFNAQGNRRTSTPMAGLPPMDQSLNVPVPPAPTNKILHMKKK